MSETRRQTSTAQRLAELRSAQPCDTTLQNLLEILTAKLDLSSRLPVFEYEADSEGFPDAASFMSALASAERESLQDVVRSLRLHLDRTSGRFSPRLAGVAVITVALVADNGAALEAMTQQPRALPGVNIVRHCHGHAHDRRRHWRAAPLTSCCSTRCTGRASRSSASRRSARCPRRGSSSVPRAPTPAGWPTPCAPARAPSSRPPPARRRSAWSSEVVAERQCDVQRRPRWRHEETRR